MDYHRFGMENEEALLGTRRTSHPQIGFVNAPIVMEASIGHLEGKETRGDRGAGGTDQQKAKVVNPAVASQPRQVE